MINIASQASLILTILFTIVRVHRQNFICCIAIFISRYLHFPFISISIYSPGTDQFSIYIKLSHSKATIFIIMNDLCPAARQFGYSVL